jgi:hypothetical protein
MLRFLHLKSGVANAVSPLALGAARSVARLIPGLAAPPEGAQEEQVEHFEMRAAAASHVVGVVVSAGFVTWALHASGLFTTLLVSMPAWRHIDPLPILAPQEDKPTWESDEEQDREEAAMSGLWRSKRRYKMEEGA